MKQILVAPNISKISKNTYRCRVSVNGTRREKLETNLKRAKSWVYGMKNGTVKY